MKLEYSTSSPERVSIWAVVCGALATACAGGFVVAIAIALLPAQWVGHPYFDLVEFLNGRVDAPDNFALAAIYFVGLICGLVLTGVMLLFVGSPRFWCRLAKLGTSEIISEARS